mmetsp:Transcript_49741/g.57071  ORF Transcript_49741/g.57071 Transcript_49741/m.57071 type:complete len:177 (+) Transcript_49741:81-611(+)
MYFGKERKHLCRKNKDQMSKAKCSTCSTPINFGNEGMGSFSSKLEFFRALSTVEQLKDVQKYVDDVDVKGQSTNNVVINAEFVSFSTDNQLSIVDQINSKDEHAEGAVNDGEDTTLNENHQNTHHDQQEQGHQEHSSHRGEVTLSGVGIHSETQGNCSSQACGNQHSHWVTESTDG